MHAHSDMQVNTCAHCSAHRGLGAFGVLFVVVPLLSFGGDVGGGGGGPKKKKQKLYTDKVLLTTTRRGEV